MSKAPKILVVDDEVLIAWNLALELETLGVEVIGPFHTLDDALTGSADPTPDMAVLDINLHDKKVWPLATVLTGKGVPILFVSADVDHAYITQHFPEARQALKPIGEDELVRQVREMTGFA